MNISGLFIKPQKFKLDEVIVEKNRIKCIYTNKKYRIPRGVFIARKTERKKFVDRAKKKEEKSHRKSNMMVIRRRAESSSLLRSTDFIRRRSIGWQALKIY